MTSFQNIDLIFRQTFKKKIKKYLYLKIPLSKIKLTVSDDGKFSTLKSIPPDGFPFRF